MDKIVDYAGQVGLKIILDHHRSDSGAGTSGNGLWYDGQHSQAEWVSDWQMLAQRYKNNPTVIGADLHNEPYNGTWGGGAPNDWAAAAELAGNAIGTVNPNWLIFVEGIGTYQGQSYWWGGNLMGVKDRPIVLKLPDKLVYSAHDYPDSVYPQPWFQGSDFPANLPAKFDQMWGYIYKEGIAPVYLGEFGTNLVDPKDAPWLKAITAYLSGDFNIDGTSDIPAGHQGISWTFWSWNPDSGDTGGILADDWNSVNQAKLAYLKPIEFDLGGTGGGTGHATVTEALAADTGSSSSDKITSNPAVTGAGDPNAAVTISEASSILGTTTADSSGNRTFTPTLADGTHILVASETNAAGTVTGQFNGASDGHGGIVITDLPLTAGGTNLIGTGGVASSAAIAPQPATITVPDGNTTVPFQSAPEVFDFSNLSFGNDTIAGFDPTQDALRLNETQVNSLTVVRNDMFATAGGIFIALDATHSITLNGVAPASLTAANLTTV
jgi:chitinase